LWADLYAQPRRHAEDGLADQTEVFEEDERWQGCFHGLNNRCFEVGFTEGIHGLSGAERCYRVHCKAAQANEDIRRLASCIVSSEYFAKPVDLAASSPSAGLLKEHE